MFDRARTGNDEAALLLARIGHTTTNVLWQVNQRARDTRLRPRR